MLKKKYEKTSSRPVRKPVLAETKFLFRSFFLSTSVSALFCSVWVLRNLDTWVKNYPGSEKKRAVLLPVQVEVPHNDDEVVGCEEHGVQRQLVVQRDAVDGEGVQARVEQDEGVVALPQEVGHSIYNVDQQEQLHNYIFINNGYKNRI